MAKKKMRLLKSKGLKTPQTKSLRLPPRDKIGRFMKRPKKVKRAKAVRKPKVVRKRSAPAFTVKRGVPVRGGREFVQRYFIDKFKKGKQTEYEVWTIASKGTPPLQSKSQVLKKVESIM